MASPNQTSRPNFILIHTDQHRADCLGLTGRRRGLHTPHLDEIGFRGMHFRQAYATCPICIPQRMTLMSGQLAKTHGVLSNIGIPHFPFEHTLPGELLKAGYQTALVGRTMHLYPEDEPYGWQYFKPGNPHSKVDDWARYIEANAPEGSGGMYGTGTSTNSNFTVPWHLPDYMHNTHWTTERALDFLERDRDPDKPFIISVGYYAPHGPFNPPQFFFDQYDHEDLDDPTIGDWCVRPPINFRPGMSYGPLEGVNLRRTRAGYYGNISHVDAQVSRILNIAKRLKNTYLIFAGDHGEMLGDHHMFQKVWPFQGSVHVPFLMMGPGIAKFQECDTPVAWHDIMPTILDLAGIDIPDTVDGKSLRPLLMGEPEAFDRTWIHGESYKGNCEELPDTPVRDNFAYERSYQYVTDGRTKYIWYNETGSDMLFDIVEDPNETVNLVNDPDWAETRTLWRERLAQELKGRPEGYSDGETLTPGIAIQLMPDTLAIARQRVKEGHELVYFSLPPEPELPGDCLLQLPDAWLAKADDAGDGEASGWQESLPGDAVSLRVDQPWNRQIVLRDYLGTVWYQTEFTLDTLPDSGSPVLAFGSIDGRCRVWLDGELMAERNTPPEEGWQDPYLVDLAGRLKAGQKHTITVRVEKHAPDCGIRFPVSIRAV